MFVAKKKIVLASGSPRRKEMLEGLGIAFTVCADNGEEPLPELRESPADYALRAAQEKARAVAEQEPEAVVLAADTVVVLDGEIMGKPENQKQALMMLTRLTGLADDFEYRTHSVITGVCLMLPSDGFAMEESIVVESEVVMRRRPMTALEAYVATGEPMDKAGGYAIQGQGGFLVATVNGSYTNVVGLPLCELVEVMLDQGVIGAGQGL